MPTKRNRCKCGGKLIREGRTIVCDSCNQYLPYKKQRVVLNNICMDRKKRDRIRYLKNKGEIDGCLKLSEAAELKEVSLLWMWNHLYLFTAKSNPLRVVYNESFIEYKPKYRSRNR